MRPCAALACGRPAVTVLIKGSVYDGGTEVTATDLCATHDGIARAIGMQRRDGEACPAIVVDVGEVAAWRL